MIFKPSPIGSRKLTPEVLAADRKSSRKFGPCGVGKEALYMGTNYIDRCFYIPWREVKRVFKRVAMSQGAYTGKGAFGALAYLVVQFGNGKEKQSRFRHEADVDRLLAVVEKEHPGIRFHLYSANADEVTEKLDRGLLDFGLMIEPFNMKQYESILLPDEDTFGFLLRRDHPLAQKAELTIEDVEHEPLIIPSQGSAVSVNLPADIFGLEPARANIVCQYNLLFNAAIMVEEGMGIALCLDRLADTSEHSNLTFRPLAPRRQYRFRFVWKKYQILTPAAEVFLQKIRAVFSS